MSNEFINVKVSGNIIKELSEKIPSNNVALNELIKNAYDADASEIEITIDTINQKLTIFDNGSGMNKDSISALFHIAKSLKKYGELRTNKRYTLGSKGLGFLSVFKFGNQATWYTKTAEDTCITFSANRSSLETCDNVTDYSIFLTPSTKLESHGTLIEISLDEDNVNLLTEYFSNQGNCLKLVNCFHDNSINLLLKIDEKEYQTQNIQLKEIYTERLFLRVTYNSSEKVIKYLYKDLYFHKLPYECNINNATINLDLNIYLLKSQGSKNITPYFFDTESNLMPLIFINKNLFNNYTLFNPGITRKIQSRKTLPQIIGYVDIETSSDAMDFNSDRTQFIQNSFTDAITKFLKNINIAIQKEGSQFKSKFGDDKFFKDLAEKLKESETNIVLKKSEAISQGELFESNALQNLTSSKSKILTTHNIKITNNRNQAKQHSLFEHHQYDIVKFTQSNKNTTLEIPSKQIKLLDYIDSVTDSSGKNINKNDLKIYVNEIVSTTKILESIDTECRKTIKFEYNDPYTGVAKHSITLHFVEAKSTLTSSIKEKLILIPARESYNIQYNKIVSNLINQINKLNVENYLDVISCSLRSIFEISILSLKNSNKYSTLNINLNEGTIQDKVKVIVEYIINSKNNMTSIANASGISYNSLTNILNPKEFKEVVAKANTTAHLATTYITEIDVRDIAKKAAIFVVLVNEIIVNEKFK